jgi:organic radical activating enzyme
LRIPTLPAFLKVEISRKCEVKCKYCFAQKDDVFYPLEEYRQLVDGLAENLFEVSLYEIGDPLHSPQIGEYIRYAHDRRIGTVISSSFSLVKPPEFWRELVASGLDRLIVAIDGITPEVYNQYRTCGNLELVLSNAREVLAARRSTGARIAVEWQMIDLPWNKHEQAGARALAAEMGFDAFTLIQEASLSRQNCDRSLRRDRNCILPFLVLTIDAYKRVRTCYKNFPDSTMIGDLKTDSWETVWNGPIIAQIRGGRTILDRVPCRYCME